MDDTKYGPRVDDTQFSPFKNPLIEVTLSKRSQTHGPFNRYAECAQALRSTISQFSPDMSDVEAEGLNQIFGKIARIITGDPSFKDHWHDIAGYATQVENHLFNTKI